MDNNQEKCGICRVKDLCPLNTFISWFEKAQVHVVLNTKFCAYFEPIQIDPVSIEKAKEQKPETCQNCEHFRLGKPDNHFGFIPGHCKRSLYSTTASTPACMHFKDKEGEVIV